MSNQQNETGLPLVRILAIVIAVMVVGCLVCAIGLFVIGLMTGDDVGRVLADEPAGHRYLLPDVCLSDDGRFLDGVTLDDLPQAVEVVATDGFALRSALERAT